MYKIQKSVKNKPILLGGIVFILLSLIGNIMSILFMDMAHIYDVIHIFPTILIYEPIIHMVGGIVISEFIFIPLALIIDFIIGMILGVVLNKFTKTEKSYLIGLIIIFLVYWIVVTYQWLPII